MLSPNATADQVFAGFFDGLHYAFDGNASVLPGWPIPAANYVSSPAALVDIDGDGIDEIFVGEHDHLQHRDRRRPGQRHQFGQQLGDRIDDGEVNPNI